MKKLNLISFAFATMSCVFVATSCQDTDIDEFVSVDHTSRSLPGRTLDTDITYADQKELFGKSMKQWAQDWWRNIMSYDCAHNPLNQSELNMSPDLTSPVVFLSGMPNGISNRYVEVPRNKALLIPVMNVLKEYPSVNIDQNPKPGQTVEQFLKIEAAKYINLATNMKVVLDRDLIKITNANRVATDLFYFKGNKDLAGCVGQAVTGQLQVGVSDGYWLVIENLSPGRHTLHTHAEILHSGIVPDVYYDIVVR